MTRPVSNPTPTRGGLWSFGIALLKFLACVAVGIGTIMVLIWIFGGNRGGDGAKAPPAPIPLTERKWEICWAVLPASMASLPKEHPKKKCFPVKLVRYDSVAMAMVIRDAISGRDEVVFDLNRSLHSEEDGGTWRWRKDDGKMVDGRFFLDPIKRGRPEEGFQGWSREGSRETNLWLTQRE